MRNLFILTVLKAVKNCAPAQYLGSGYFFLCYSFFLNRIIQVFLPLSSFNHEKVARI